MSLKMSKRLRLLIDQHNPGPSDLKPDIYIQLHHLAQASTQNHEYRINEAGIVQRNIADDNEHSKWKNEIFPLCYLLWHVEKLIPNKTVIFVADLLYKDKIPEPSPWIFYLRAELHKLISTTKEVELPELFIEIPAQPWRGDQIPYYCLESEILDLTSDYYNKLAALLRNYHFPE